MPTTSVSPATTTSDNQKLSVPPNENADPNGRRFLISTTAGRLTPCELMKIRSGLVSVPFNGQVIDVSLNVRDLGDERHIGVLAQRNLVIGHRKFSREIRIELELKGMTSEETGSLYD